MLNIKLNEEASKQEKDFKNWLSLLRISEDAYIDLEDAVINELALFPDLFGSYQDVLDYIEELKLEFIPRNNHVDIVFNGNDDIDIMSVYLDHYSDFIKYSDGTIEKTSNDYNSGAIYEDHLKTAMLKGDFNKMIASFLVMVLY